MKEEVFINGWVDHFEKFFFSVEMFLLVNGKDCICSIAKKSHKL